MHRTSPDIGEKTGRPMAVAVAGAMAVVVAMAGAGCGATTMTAAHRSPPTVPSESRSPARAAKPSPPRPPLPPRVLPVALDTRPTPFVPAVRWRGQTAIWLARRPGGVALLSFNQRLVALRLHSGTVDAGSAGWRYGPSISGHERRALVGAFNGGFKFNTGAGGFELGGRTAVTLGDGLGSIVTYASGRTDVGAWRAGVPAPNMAIVSVRQNLHLLVVGGHPASTIGCLLCWGATLGGTPSPARSALGITGDGRMVWAGGENLTPAALAAALTGARVQRAVELDINPEWVAGYLYGHHRGRGPLVPVPVVPGQPGVPGQFLAPYSRDFFTIVAR